MVGRQVQGRQHGSLVSQKRQVAATGRGDPSSFVSKQQAAGAGTLVDKEGGGLALISRGVVERFEVFSTNFSPQTDETYGRIERGPRVI